MRVVVPFRAGGKSRLPSKLRSQLALGMLGDVVEAAARVGAVHVVTADPEGARVASELGAAAVRDPGGGQGAAVAAGLADAEGSCLVVNADLPRATTEALHRLAAAGAALVAAADGTTNALSLPDPSLFRPLYGPGSAARFTALGLVPVSIPELEDDLDTLADLERAGPQGLGRRTTLVVSRHERSLSRAR